MTQVTEFRIGYHEPIFGKNDTLEEAVDFIRKAGIGKKVIITITTKDKDED